jgi:hypothetical protein
MTLHGALDGISLAGYVEGWAYDTKMLLCALPVAVIDYRSRIVARGLAGLYRKDLAYEDRGAGWCAFHLRLRDDPVALAWKRMTLVHADSRKRISRSECVAYLVSDPARQSGVAGLLADDPTVVQSLDQLRACEELFGEFIKYRGIEAFVRAAYRYLLLRPVDPSGLSSSTEHLRAGSLSPFGLIQTLGDSDEYRSRPRKHCAPIMPAFPFKLK